MSYYTAARVAQYCTMQMDINRVQAMLMSGDSHRWHIDQEFAITSLAKYLANMQMMSNSNDTVALLERQRSMNAPALLDSSGYVVHMGRIMSGTAVAPGTIMRINLTGPMIANGDLCTWGADEIEEAIMMANNNSNIDGIFIRANTGGGEALAGQIIHNAVKSSSKAVLVYADFLASAGIHATLSADEIIASGKGSRFGSIGTYVSIDKEFANWYNDNVEDVYSDVSPDKNIEWREYLKGNQVPLKTSVTQNAKMFQDEVKAYRNLKGDVDETLRGGVFFAEKAKSKGLVDGIGTLEYAFQRLQANIKRRKAAR